MRKNIQFFLMYTHTFLGKHLKTMFSGMIVGFIVTLLIIQIYPLYNEYFGQKEIKIAIVGTFTETTLPLNIQNQISLGLTSLTLSGEATTSIATSWEVDSKKTTYIFHLNKNLFWHDNKPFTAKDVNYKLQGATFTPTDNYNLKVILKEPYAPLPVILSQPLFKANLNGLGFYKVSKINFQADRIENMTLIPIDNKYPILTYKFYPSNDAAILAFKLGEVDKLQNITDIGELATWKKLSVKSINLYDRIVLVIFNLQNQYLKEKEIRQAITYGVPLFKDNDKALSPISPQSWTYSKNIRLYNYDLETAKKILSKTPLSSNSAQLVLSTYVSNLSLAQTLVDSWSKTGLAVKIKVEKSLPSNFDMFLTIIPIPPDPDQYPYWQSTQDTTNLSHYSSQKIDQLLETGRKTLEIDARIKIYADFQRYLIDDAPVIFLYYPKAFIVERQ